ncbi:hypothetical protein PHLCEN_2v3897 [Hermanssonia centrifuga]|uniref:Uncharacterized protein n=1 Tax=Hermanssonia centrifuga TaxID=98765 RepID=A0A2R6QB94_9APHY|nr:hypothetical protein PHLCEN_2v3897 [Hermanssonia centrifuga]
MVALKSMASGDPIDVQREKRWPNHASATEPKVVFQPWEEDSDFSDMEGVVPNSGNIRMIDPANDKEWPSD